jgi:lipoate-protein ligase A
MAVDQALLDDTERTGCLHFRLYRWDPACISFGRSEPALIRYDREMVERLGVAVVRRPTGGRAVWHEHEMTYAVTAPIDVFGSLRAAYWAIHERLAWALRTLGIPVELARHSPSVRPTETGSCFSGTAGGELLFEGRKLVGSAQVRQGGAFLQHGSILLDGSQDLLATLRRPPLLNDEGRCAGAATLREALGRAITFKELAAAILGQWPPIDAVTPSAGPAVTSVARSRFESPGWIWRR